MKRSRGRWKKIHAFSRPGPRWNKPPVSALFSVPSRCPSPLSACPWACKGASAPDNRRTEPFALARGFFRQPLFQAANSGLVAAWRHRSAGRRAGVECCSRGTTASGPHRVLHRSLRSLARGAGTIATPAAGRKPDERKGALRSGHGGPRRARRRDVAGPGTRSAN